ncbi:MAG TPA: beta-propeller fold lactonase family protein [bacterium]|nr:beta-propeller fold lactonase family protein [bacterium]
MPAVVYVACADSQEICVGHLDGATGALNVIQRAPVPGAVMPLAIGPGRKFLYAGLRSEPFSVATLAIDQTAGTLRLDTMAPLPDNMAYLSTDKTGRFLLSASYPGNKMSINPIGRNGAVKGRPVQIVLTPPHPHSILTDPSNRHVFVPCLGADTIMQYRFNSDNGRVTPNTPPAVEAARKAGPRHLVFHPFRPFAYSTNELDATVGAYRFDAAAGALAPIGTWTLLPPGHAGGAPFAAADIHVAPDGRFLYASERASNSLAAFTVDAETGMLAPAGTVRTEEKPRGFNIDPRGRYLLSVGQVSHHLTSYAIDPRTGALAPRHRYAMGANPNWVEIVHLG